MLHDTAQSLHGTDSPQPAPALHAFDRQSGGYSYNSLGSWLRPVVPTGVIITRAIEMFILSHPGMHEALAEWLSVRWPGPAKGSRDPYSALMLWNVSPGDVMSFAEAKHAGEHASILLDMMLVYRFGWRTDRIGEFYEGEPMMGGLLIRANPDGTFDFSTHT